MTVKVTVPEAARILETTPDAVRSRLRRGKLRRAEAPDGTVLVVLDGDGQDGQDEGHPTVGYIDALRSENELLRRELEAWQEEARRKDHIIMNMTEAMKAIAPPEPRDGRETAAGEPDGEDPRPANEGAQEAAERRSWWRRFLYGE